jgi:hypothetical protein
MSRIASTFAVVLSLLAPGSLAAQHALPTGHWEGNFVGPNGEVSVELDLSVNGEGTLTGMLGTGDVKGVPLSHFSVEGRVVRFEIPSAGARFSATLDADSKTMSGEFVNPAGSAPTVLTRTGDARIAATLKSAAIGKELEGTWNGILEVEGRKKRLVLRMANQPDGTSIGTIISVDDGGIELPVALVQSGRRLTVEIKLNGGLYAGELNASATELTGTYTERGFQAPLTMRR